MELINQMTQREGGLHYTESYWKTGDGRVECVLHATNNSRQDAVADGLTEDEAFSAAWAQWEND